MKKIFILKNRALGDSILGLSALEYIKSLFPQVQITYGVPQWITPFYKNINIPAESVFPLNVKKAQGIYSLYQLLKSERFDFILELHQSSSTQKILTLLSFITKTPYYFHNHHRKDQTIIHGQGQI